ncbi:hypothetical protein [Vibrio owensii]|uniref:hypothetical protein n=1 Tax=Vibrio owensii TaxID=696485 RepID=UPI003CC57ED0
MSFFNELLQPRGYVEAKLDEYEETGLLDKYCKILSVGIFAIFPLICMLIAVCTSGFTATSFLINTGVSIIMGGTIVGFMWLTAYMQSMVSQWIGGEFAPKRLLLTSIAAWKHIMVSSILLSVVIIVVSLLLGDFAVFVHLALVLYFGIAYGLGLIAAALKCSLKKALVVYLASCVLITLASKLFLFLLNLVMLGLLSLA